MQWKEAQPKSFAINRICGQSVAVSPATPTIRPLPDADATIVCLLKVKKEEVADLCCVMDNSYCPKDVKEIVLQLP